MLVVLFSLSLQFINGIFHTLFLVLQEAPECWGWIQLWIQLHPRAGQGWSSVSSIWEIQGMFSAMSLHHLQWCEYLGRSFFLVWRGLHPEKACQRDILDQIPVFLRGGREQFYLLPSGPPGCGCCPSCHTQCQQSGDSPGPGWKVLTSPKSSWISLSGFKTPS